MSKTLALVAIALAIVASIGYIVTSAIAMKIRDSEPSTSIRGSIPRISGNTLNDKVLCNTTPPVVPPNNATQPMTPHMKRPRRGLAKPYIEVEVSEEFKQKVIEILNSNPNTSSLLEEGYNITSVKPVIKFAVQGDGGIVMKATKAVVLMAKPGVGRAVVRVDVERGVVEEVIRCETRVRSAIAGSAEAQSVSGVWI